MAGAQELCLRLVSLDFGSSRLAPAMASELFGRSIPPATLCLEGCRRHLNK